MNKFVHFNPKLNPTSLPRPWERHCRFKGLKRQFVLREWTLQQLFLHSLRNLDMPSVCSSGLSMYRGGSMSYLVRPSVRNIFQIEEQRNVVHCNMATSV